VLTSITAIRISAWWLLLARSSGKRGGALMPVSAISFGRELFGFALFRRIVPATL
jgi:hypothetical protein